MATDPVTHRPPSASAGVIPPATSPLVVLAIAVLGISFAAPLVRLSAAPAIVIAAWRLGFSLVIIALFLLVRGEWRDWRRLDRRELVLSVSAGLLLALHFWTWNLSLQYTTVAASVSLVSMQPVIIAAVSSRWLGERASGIQWLGITLAVVGAVVVGSADVPGGLSGMITSLAGTDAAGVLGSSPLGAGPLGAGPLGADDAGRSRALLGDLLATMGAVAGALYYLIGRRIRRTLSLWPYVGLVYGAAFVGCVVLALATGQPLGPQPPRELAIFAGLALGPMLLGHTGMNWALGHLPAYVVNLTTLGEPIGATLLAALLPGIAEVPGPWTLVGGVLVLGGVVLATRRS